MSIFLIFFQKIINYLDFEYIIMIFLWKELRFLKQKGLDFKHKEVINITDGKRLGFVQDVNADLNTGTITSIIVPGTTRLLNVFSGGNEIVIPWNKVKVISDDLILVEI